MRGTDIYQLLNISHKSSKENVKQAFRTFAKQNHPDLYPDDKIREEKFKAVSAEYQNWKLIRSAVDQIKKIQRTYHNYEYTTPSGFKPWSFSCQA